MNREVDEADWRLFRERMPLWRERQIEKMVRNYQDILSSEGTAEERFFRLDKRHEKDLWNVIFSIEMSRSKLIMNIVRLLGEGIITMSDLEGFSIEFIERVKPSIRK